MRPPSPAREGPWLSPVLLRLYAAEALGSVSGVWLTVGLPFFTHHRFGWGAGHNFLLGAAQGITYVLGALTAPRAARRWGRRAALVRLYAALAAVGAAIAGAAERGSEPALVALVLLETGLVATTWPLLESLVSAGAGPAALSRRLGVYNVVWAVTSALALAASGAIIQYAPPWVFFGLVVAGHLGALALLSTTLRDARPTAPPGAAPEQDRAPDAELVRQRRLALWLSRLSLPATYVVVYALAPLFPSLPGVKALSPAAATLLASVWLLGRAAAFVLTGRSTAWHRRPDLLLWASAAMLLGFVGTVAPPLLVGAAPGPVIAAMVAAELLLGLSLGVIYAGSLYFGMVSSEGSTEHGGYHEALIGCGQALGPAVGAVALWARPGDLGVSVAAVTGVIALSVALAGAVRLRAGRAPAPRA
ncbi:MAG TPA: MFS transporter [Polyangiaceae bacterium]|nr:MFS transporter [Polyangiaceae bacterium]